MTGLRTLSVRPPWSWAIAYAGKDVENHTWGTRHRGLIAIHASLKAEPDVLFPVPRAIRAYLDGQRDLDQRLDVRGAVVAVAEVAGCHPGVSACGRDGRGLCSPWALWDQWHWVLTSVRPLAVPVPCKGALGLWTLPDDVESAVRAQLGEK